MKQKKKRVAFCAMHKSQHERRASLFIMKFNKAQHERRAFSCGFQPIDNFLKSSISEQIKNNLVAVWVAVEDNSTFSPVKGFYALNAHTIAQAELPDLVGKSGKQNIPAIYLNAVAVDQTCQERGVGTALLVHAIKKSVEFSEEIGCAVIILDVLDDGNASAFKRRVTFYKKLGFKVIENAEHPHRMFLSIVDARTSI